MSLPSEIYSVADVRSIDRAAIDGAGIDGYTLMTRAAEAALAQALDRYPGAMRCQVVCGAGNNAGDGYVFARLAAASDLAVSVLAVAEPESLVGDAATAYADFITAGGSHDGWHGEITPDADFVVDALLGSGLSREVSGVYAEVVEAINRHPAPVLALDIPSGLDGDTGEPLGAAVAADLTVTFVGLKSGLFLQQGPAHVGELRFADLDIPANCREAIPYGMQLIGERDVRAALPPRERDAHKGDFGHLLIVGGGPGMPGAVVLCAAAGLRCGAGKVSVATHPDHRVAFADSYPELMGRGVATPAELAPLLQQATALVIGPGLGQSDWARPLFATAIDCELPTVVDADALRMLGETERRRADWILTPHPGEAAVLAGVGTEEIQRDRRAAVQRLQQQYDGTVVLKGAGTLVQSAAPITQICARGNPGMASPGMGDVLAGVIGALLAQGLALPVAATVGVEIHARAGDAAVAAAGERGLLASDLLPYLRQQVNP